MFILIHKALLVCLQEPKQEKLLVAATFIVVEFDTLDLKVTLYIFDNHSA